MISHYSMLEVSKIIGGQCDVAADTIVQDVALSIKTVSPGLLFFALPGRRRRNVVKEAFQRGAVGAVVPTNWPAPSSGEYPLLRVACPREALFRLACQHRSRSPNLHVVGVTGSFGKTTTKDLCAAALSPRFRVLRTPGSCNGITAIARTMLRLTPEHGVAVFEMGIANSRTPREKARFVRPKIGVVTNIGLSHFARVESHEAVIAAKMALLEELPEDGIAVLNRDDPFLAELAGRDRQLTFYGFSDAADVQGRLIAVRGIRKGAQFLCRAPTWFQGEIEVTLPRAGRHNAHNALAAIAVALHLGVEPEALAPALAASHITSMRMQMLRARRGGYHIIHDAYNASSPQAVVAALEALATLDFNGRRVAALGDMLELGSISKSAHRDVGRGAARWLSKDDLLVTIGRRAAGIAAGARDAGFPEEAVIECKNKQTALAALHERLQPGDLVLVKGSRGMRLETLVRQLRRS